ncbi:NADPH oxidase organizer 1b [Antennarius striatus]|uniref:NADPH oxidase organizer 1b n=1 Tax=Antennarius striatus TaxID=241820 RepID=UPI0035AEE05B
MTGEQRFVISARIIGAVRRETPKLKMFMISVLWSDETEVIVYRSFRNFKEFHGELKKKFTQSSTFQKKTRMIPKFGGKAAMSSLPQRGSKKPFQIMKTLEIYCGNLLKSDPAVTQSSEVTQFFMPKDHDLQPDFIKNSVIILLSDGSGGEENVTQRPAGVVTHPFVTQTYCCVAAYETKDTKNRPFNVALNEKLDVLIKDPAGWWLVEKDDKRLAWFPAPYLELQDGEESDDEVHLGGSLYCAVRSYSAKSSDEVSVPIGSVVEVLQKSDNGWWLIRFNDKGGYIPSMYLQPYNNPRAGLYNLQKKKVHGSTLNLASSYDSSHTLILNKGIKTHPESAGKSRGKLGNLHKARSLDILAETQSPIQAVKDASKPNRYARRMTDAGIDGSFSISNSNEETEHHRSLANVSQNDHSSPEPNLSDRRGSSASTESSTSASSRGSETAPVAPRIPRRPKTEEIMTRCTTVTRKAAMATKTRLQIQAESTQSR